ncbi:polyketide synthase [Penicillium angulare]|uniref:polyketide synthase n=1 Tax=Penicillium angulare TaxID=116970 RepID=UPI002540F3E4|nr:polyketide synthase [Penicillium angulare]KAJ5287311.1 polyketide synthase [Penicillium angulare]
MPEATSTSRAPSIPPADGIAIVGYSFKLPQDVDNDDSLWEALESRRNLRTEWPTSRINPESFTNNASIKAASMDPMQRWTLEESYRAFENAGIPVESLRGSSTAVFSASMLEDKARMAAIDPENTERTVVTGSTVACLIPNRVSWYFDLRGPSMHVNTACSSSLSAIDMACKMLQSGDASCALVTASNICLDPSIFQMLSNQNFLSPDSLCYSFDHRANGYARGEGVIAFVLKPIFAAVQSGDMIRAIIRSTASNQDGHSPVLTQPSLQAQEELIRHVYKRAKLSFHETRYVEAHGTGTPVGDPIEAKAIGRVFRKFRSSQSPLYVGSIKANIGHLEGASGLASLLKAILILERGIIPPQALMEKVNPAIDAEFFAIEIPKESIIWPTSGLRRVSVNSFGFGGSNTHVILDDALHYLESHDLAGNHRTASKPGDVTQATDMGWIYSKNGDSGNENMMPTLAAMRLSNLHKCPPQLLVWTGSDKRAVERIVNQYKGLLSGGQFSEATTLRRLAFTLSDRRSQMLWRSFAMIGAPNGGQVNWTIQPVKPVRSSSQPGLAFIFTGQGAQYVEMGLELIQYRVFANSLRRIDQHFADFGCSWSIFGRQDIERGPRVSSMVLSIANRLADELRNADKIDLPEYSQPMLTALQIALVDLLNSFGIVPKAVVGHSSGEIAAAYTTGALSLSSACRVAYFRGKLTDQLRAASTASPGAMLAINIAEGQVKSYLMKSQLDAQSQVTIACVNSPSNCTLSGPEEVISEIKSQADLDGVFSQKVNTGVAYHSPSMNAISDEYNSLTGPLECSNSPERAKPGSIPMVSSVTGQVASPKTLVKAQYWVDNLVSPVRFADAVQLLTQKTSTLRAGIGSITDLVEIGPHSALRRAVRDTIEQPGNKNKEHRYHASLQKSQSSLESIMNLAGQLFCIGHKLSVSTVNRHSVTTPPSFLTNCPSYPFDRSNNYWKESRISRDFRLRESVYGETLGVPVSDWNPFEPRWRNFLSVETTPWLAQHKISDTVIYPAAGILLLAMEAARQIVPSNDNINGYFVKEIDFLSPIIIAETWEERTETQVCLRQIDKRTANMPEFDIAIFSYYRGKWTKCCKAIIQVEINGQNSRLQTESNVSDEFKEAKKLCTRPLESYVVYNDATRYGLQYGEMFQQLQDMSWDGEKRFFALLDVTKNKLQTRSLVHPAVLDTLFQALVLSADHKRVGRIPVRLVDAWFASSGWQHPECGSIRLLGKFEGSTSDLGSSKRTSGGRAYAVTENGRILCYIKNASLATVTKDVEEQKKLIHRIEWKPQLGMLEPDQWVHLMHHTPEDGATIARNFVKLRYVLDIAIIKAVSKVSQNEIPKNLSRHFEWLQRHFQNLPLHRRLEGESTNDLQLEAKLCEVDSVLPDWKVYTACARDLTKIMTGEINPLELIFNSDLADTFYAALFRNICTDGRLQRVLDLASHSDPAMRILEVGAGTGGMTRHVMSALKERDSRAGTRSFSEYTYTDVSPMFLDRGRSRWSDLEAEGRMKFQTFDMNRPFESQGFVPASYDLIIAGSVLHATPDLEATIRNIRKALKPGGHLILLEAIKPNDVITNFMAGLVPGWWVAREKWRYHSPAITETMWHHYLRNNGFSGNDLVIRDYENEDSQFVSIILTTALEDRPEVHETSSTISNITLLVDDEQCEQLEMAKRLSQHLGLRTNSTINILPFDEAKLQQPQAKPNSETIFVSLVEVYKPLLARLTKDGFAALRALNRISRRLLWVTANVPDDPLAPEYGVAQGFFRTLRGEQPSNHFVNLSVDSEYDLDTVVSGTARVLEASFGSAQSDELEYVMRDGILMTGRVVENSVSNNALHRVLSPQVQKIPWGDAGPLELSLSGKEVDNSVQFVQDTTYRTIVASDEIEIEAKAWSLSRTDSHGGISSDSCAGLVTRVGPGCDESIRLGDRVYMYAINPLRKYPRAHQTAVVKIPESVSLETACSIIGPKIAAFYAMIEIARIEEGQTVLIHSAASDVGRIAVRLAQQQGAHVYATSASVRQTDLLVNVLKIPADNVFSSRDHQFAADVLQATDGAGVDVVLNSLVEKDMLDESCECLAPGGRFIAIGHVNFAENLTLSLGILSKNIIFSIIDLADLPKVLKQLARDAFISLIEAKIQAPQPKILYSISQAEDAFRLLQGEEMLDRVIISAESGDVISGLIEAHVSQCFDDSASYLVAGGFGGLGIAIIEWMVERGAKYLIILSRSGAKSRAAIETVTRLVARGVKILSPRCDLSSESSLTKALEEAAQTMPPINGCINAAMVLQDGIFQENMSFEKWEITLRSKVETSWNLHRLLPRGLDFFILLSSLAGPVGMMGSSNYAGGCSFQDELARYRVGLGEAALSIDIGWMRDIGIIAENKAYQRQRQDAGDFRPIEGSELLALLDIYISRKNSQKLPDDTQILLGLLTPADHLLEGNTPPSMLGRPLFSSYTYLPNSGTIDLYSSTKNYSSRFRQSTDSGERVQIVLEALSAKLARTMSISVEDVEPSKPLSKYGVDSLMSVDLRNWIGKEFGATVAVFDIMGEEPLASIADLVVAKTIL